MSGKPGGGGVEIRTALWEDMHPESTLHTDGAQHYKLNVSAAKNLPTEEDVPLRRWVREREAFPRGPDRT